MQQSEKNSSLRFKFYKEKPFFLLTLKVSWEEMNIFKYGKWNMQSKIPFILRTEKLWK